MLSVIDLFAGCGGMSLGLELAGFSPILAAELSVSARATYEANRVGREIEVQEDVRSLAALSRRELRKLAKLGAGVRPTLVSGGPPCQGFSGIGHRRTNCDVEKSEIVSNHLYVDMVSIISKLNPEAFLFENVRGLLSARWTRQGSRKVWDEIREHFLDKLGGDYVVAFELVHGYDYGVVQNRPRVLMVGLRRARWLQVQREHGLGLIGLSPDSVNARTRAGERLGYSAMLIPRPLPREVRAAFLPDLDDLLGDLVDPRWAKPDWRETAAARGELRTNTYPKAAKNDWQISMRARTTRDVSKLQKGSELSEQEYSRHSARVVDRFALIRAGKQLPSRLRTKKFAQRALPRRWGGTDPHITVASLPDDFVHFEQPRSITVREWARMQGFPDWYVFKGPRTTGGSRRAGNVRDGDSVREAPRYTQIGNAVPVPLAAAIGWHVRSLLPELTPQQDTEETLLGRHLQRFLNVSAD